MVFVTEDAHENGELSKLDSRLFRQQKGLTKDCISHKSDRFLTDGR